MGERKKRGGFFLFHHLSPHCHLANMQKEDVTLQLRKSVCFWDDQMQGLRKWVMSNLEQKSTKPLCEFAVKNELLPTQVKCEILPFKSGKVLISIVCIGGGDKNGVLSFSIVAFQPYVDLDKDVDRFLLGCADHLTMGFQRSRMPYGMTKIMTQSGFVLHVSLSRKDDAAVDPFLPLPGFWETQLQRCRTLPADGESTVCMFHLKDGTNVHLQYGTGRLVLYRVASDSRCVDQWDNVTLDDSFLSELVKRIARVLGADKSKVVLKSDDDEYEEKLSSSHQKFKDARTKFELARNEFEEAEKEYLAVRETLLSSSASASSSLSQK